VGTAAFAPAAPPSAEPKDTLKLSKSDTAAGKGAGASKGGGASQDRVNALQEEVASKDRALRESQSRVAISRSRSSRCSASSTSSPGARRSPRHEDRGRTDAAHAGPRAAEGRRGEAGTREARGAAEDGTPKVAEAPKTEPPKAGEPPKDARSRPSAEGRRCQARAAEAAAAPKKAAPPPKDWTTICLDNCRSSPGLAALGLLGAGRVHVHSTTKGTG
jgi:hypothetical protein